MAWLLLGVAAAESSLDKLARWQFEWHRTAEAEAQRAMATGLANSMLDSHFITFKGVFNTFSTFVQCF